MCFFPDTKINIHFDEEVGNVGLIGLFYGYFFRCDSIEPLDVVKILGWNPLTKLWGDSWLNWENRDMEFLGIREPLKWLKFGYKSATDQIKVYIRDGELTIEEGLKIIKEREGKLDAKKESCEYMGVSEEDFDRIRDSFVNLDIFKKDKNREGMLKKPPQ
jgi:hypothetical protein